MRHTVGTQQNLALFYIMYIYINVSGRICIEWFIVVCFREHTEENFYLTETYTILQAFIIFVI